MSSLSPSLLAKQRADVLAALRDILGPQIGGAVSDPKAPTGPLWPIEAQAMARAIPKRRDEFTAGRDAARAAMLDLGLPPTAIPHGTDRAPVWPDGLTGSIAHCDHICIAAVARTAQFRALGLDIEPAIPLEIDLIPTICTPGEQRWIATQSNPGLAAKMIFCAKEAVYKAQYMQTRTLIDFDAVETEISLEQGLFLAMISPERPLISSPISGALRQIGDYFLASCQLPPPLS